ncbi:prolipoprotein diacylglyceryl transferase [Lysinibacter sp. HNR]|uniref:prolipoprotein diacylglyceryl transferase n=1 Tax=Lysinibacter sp. HNR TaxID=3031408 RepID=UPI0024351A78|nr:prolipoprotein diacylglyceryl transferase [Lysinibacter sp. HNR]WGD38629.1 prolipoprotein diacylglyceryl transferase [Lysinibacter sp. HNR]
MTALLPMSIPSPDVSYWTLTLPWGAELRLHFYALCILAGIIAAGIITNYRLTKRGGENGVTIDFGLFTVVLGIIGARMYHVLTHPGDFFYPGAEWWKVFAVWEGGIAIFGALLGGAVGAFIASRYTGIRFWSFADALAPGLLVAQALGRLGNYFNQELFGLPTDLPWGLQIDSNNPAFPVGLAPDTLFQPTFLYEIIWNLLGVAVILYLERRFRTRWGQTFALYLIWYGVGRAWLETLRVDPIDSFLGLRLNLWTALLAVVVGLLIIIIQRREHPGVEPSVYLPGRTPKSQTGSKKDSDDVSSEDENTHYVLERTPALSEPTVEQSDKDEQDNNPTKN